MNLALSNVINVIEYYRDKNEDVEVDIVAYGPGLQMLRADTSPVQDRVRRLKDMVFPGKISSRSATTPSRPWRRQKGMRFPFWPMPPSFPPASST